MANHSWVQLQVHVERMYPDTGTKVILRNDLPDSEVNYPLALSLDTNVTHCTGTTQLLTIIMFHKSKTTYGLYISQLSDIPLICFDHVHSLTVLIVNHFLSIQLISLTADEKRFRIKGCELATVTMSQSNQSLIIDTCATTHVYFYPCWGMAHRGSFSMFSARLPAGGCV